MKKQFNWEFDESPNERPSGQKQGPSRSPAARFWITAVLLTLVIIGGWTLLRRRQDNSADTLKESAQAIVDLMHEAVVAGDGELFFSQKDPDGAWFAAQLTPQVLNFYRAQPVITNVKQSGEMLHANAVWQEDGQQYQRVLFFSQYAGQLREAATDPAYWGERSQSLHTWGRLSYHEIDQPWTPAVAAHIKNKIDSICAPACETASLPLNIEMRSDFSLTAEPGHLAVPSPRLLGLDRSGKPGDPFWRALDRRLGDYLAPATIRFAVPPTGLRDGQTLLPYDSLARQFMRVNPSITVEVVHLDALPTDPSELALQFDGAAVPPTEGMLVDGHVADLTDYINSDPEFEKTDFYEQVWQGTIWRDRSWFIPEAAEMKVLYYDKAAYQAAELTEPSSRWTWDEMAQDIASIAASRSKVSWLQWGFLDVGLDSLFSFAYNWNNDCQETATVFCQTPLQSQNVSAALNWYKEMADRPGHMPDLSGRLADTFSESQLSTMGNISDEERQVILLLNFQGSRRKSAVWVDAPVNYEFNLLLSPVGVVSFPGSDRFDGISPLWLRGSYISSHSEHPLAVWQWLKFLSSQPPIPRYIPARPSVAAKSGYWTQLPRPLDDVMRTAFPFARPVTIAEKEMITWDQVAAILSGTSDVDEAVRDRPSRRWFGQE
jgi:ABC-type glycerol-3-phosphate transport system substrate-binding protein